MDQEKLKFLRECLKVLRWEVELETYSDCWADDDGDTIGEVERYILVRKKSRSHIVGQCDTEAGSEEELLRNNATFIEKWYKKQEGRQE